MQKTNTRQKQRLNNESLSLTNSTIELVSWPPSFLPDNQILALQTTRLPSDLTSVLTTQKLTDEVSPFSYFNLGLHVGDNENRVLGNRQRLNRFIDEQLSQPIKSTNIQWLNQVHGNEVIEVSTVNQNAINADASITREKNIALAIMTADCLPILLSHNKGTEVAAIHGGWRPLATNIIAKTVGKMQSAPSDLIAWLGPCIGKTSFEVGVEVKDQFISLNKRFSQCFVEQHNGKYLADLHQIASIQLQALGVNEISTLQACTFLRTDKYYSYRKDKITGRMASIICRR